MNLTDTFDRSNSPHSVAATARSIDSANSLLDRLADDLEREMLAAWQAGSTRLAEEWLDRHPEVKAKPELAVRVIYEELCLREEHGESVDLDELRRRFPQFREALSLLLSCHRLMNSDAAVFPRPASNSANFICCENWGTAALVAYSWRRSLRSPIGRWW